MRANRLQPLFTLLLVGCITHPTGVTLERSELPLAEQVLQPGSEARRVATIRHYGDPAVVEVPWTARSGEPVEIHVTTYGGGCVREDTTVASVAGLSAEVVPYQRVYAPRSQEACTSELRITRRSVRLAFAAVGQAKIRVIGRAAPGDSLVAVERRLIVR